MKGRRPAGLAFLLLYAAVALALVPFASGGSADVNGTGTIAGSGTSYTIAIANTGTEPILCFQVVLPAGVLATGIGTPPAGWQLGASQPPPAPIFGGRSATGIPPGATATFTFTTSAALPAGTQLKLSPDCRVDITVATTGPTAPAPPPPPPKPKKCECDSLEVVVENFQPDPRRLSFYLDWTLECTKAGEGRCKGKLTVELATAARKAGVHVSVSRAKAGARGALVVDCEGQCDRFNPRREFPGYSPVTLIAPAREPFGPQGVGSVMLEVERFCKRELTTKRFRIAFNAHGIVSKRRSDLNGNGKADGKET